MLGTKFDFSFALSLFELTESGGDLVVGALVLFALSKQVRLKELVLSFNLLVVLLHSFKSLHQLLNSECCQVSVP